MTDDKPKTLEQRTMGERLFENARQYLIHNTREYYLKTYCDIILEGNFAKSGVFKDNPHAYIRVVKTFAFFLELHAENQQ